MEVQEVVDVNGRIGLEVEDEKEITSVRETLKFLCVPQPWISEHFLVKKRDFLIKYWNCIACLPHADGIR